ncbi:MlaD family protein [Paraferrimonas sp. SM1919]|uniref:MlaD family protein n=1 Tax=Paraferrimonas sp. SM1919 TaxID=2662263 RepID=UPI0013D173C1|nr:MlaD family protein [Paraferrimonas sp. SM1919]
MTAEDATIRKQKMLSPVWILPVLALFLVAWLGFKNYQQRGATITIAFPSAAGMEVGKTLVKYQGLNVGKVTYIDIADDLKGVEVSVEIDYRAKDLLTEGSKFWLVAPKASITGVEGLDALFSGNYISLLPGEGRSQSEFIAEEQAPLLQQGENGLNFVINTDSLGSLKEGSPIYFKQIPVGSILNYQLTKQNQVTISAFIEEQYAYLVNANSRFWNVSGITAKANLNGISLQTESLASILAGGIAFSSPSQGESIKDGHSFKLYKDQDQANVGRTLTFTAEHPHGLSTGAAIIYRQLNIGEVSEITLLDEGVEILVDIYKPYDSLLKIDSQFWIAGAEVSLAGSKNLSRLITGPAIEFLPSEREQIGHDFTLLTQAPKTHLGQLYQFSAAEDFGLTQGAIITHKDFTIGEITQVKLADDFNSVEFTAEIYPEFSKLITPNSYFVHRPMMQLDASLDGVNVNSGAISSALTGQIQVVNDDTKGKLALYKDQQQAHYQRQLADYSKVILQTSELNGVSPQQIVSYKGMEIGFVDNTNWNSEQDHFTITIKINPNYQNLLNGKQIFWQQAALDVEAGVSGLKIKVAPLQQAIKGGIVLSHLEPESSLAANDILYVNEQDARAQAKYVKVTFPTKSTLTKGAAVKYLGQKIGHISELTMSADLQQLNATLALYQPYAQHFSKQGTQFYQVSAELGAAKIANLETLVSGSYIASLPGAGAEQNQFIGTLLSPNIQPSNGLNLVLTRTSMPSLKVGSGLFFRGVKIGEVTQLQLAANAQQVEIHVNIGSQWQHLVNQSSQFWDLSGIEIDFGIFSGTKVDAGSIETLLSGGIGVVTELSNDESAALSAGAELPMHKSPEPDWLEWQPKLMPRDK